MDRLCVALTVFLCLGGIATDASSQEEERLQTDLSEEAHARLFVVPVRIEPKKDAKAEECAGLTAADLSLRVRGRQLGSQAVQDMAQTGSVTLDRSPRPMLHAVVIDTSGSMSLDLPQAKAAASGYFEGNLGPLDKAMIVSFDDSVTLRQRATSRTPKLLAAVDELEVAGQTSLFDALVHTIRELDIYRERPVIVLISDGQDNASFYDSEDVIEELQQRPDLTVFAIGIGQRSQPIRQMLQRIAKSTFGIYFDVDQADELDAVFEKIRAILGAEAILSVVDPEPNAGPGGVRVKSKRGACEVTVLVDPERTHEEHLARKPIKLPPPPLPLRFREFLSYSHRKILAQGTLVRGDADCFGTDRSIPRQLSEWDFEVGTKSISGCAPDIALSHGYLYDPGADPFVGRNEAVQVKIRRFEFDVPPFDTLEQDPVRLVEAILASLPETPPNANGPLDRQTMSRWLTGTPVLVNGTTFLEMRPRLAQALVSHPSYGDWAMGRLSEWIEADIRDLEERYRQLFPDQPIEAVRVAAQNSSDARAIRARLEAPTEIDLQPFLAAWLGDIESHTLFSAWEREAVQGRLEGTESEEAGAGFLANWHRLRALLSKPSTTRIVAPLVLMYESECDCVGFYRIILPRPGFMRARIRERNPFFQAPLLDMPPKMPFGYAFVGALERQLPDAVEMLHGEGYRLKSIGYELLGPTEFHDPERAFHETRVRLDLQRAGSGEDKDNAASVKITADLHLALPPRKAGEAPAATPQRRARWLIDNVEVDVRNDEKLKKLFRKPNEALVGYELLPRSAMTPISNSSDRDDSTPPGS